MQLLIYTFKEKYTPEKESPSDPDPAPRFRFEGSDEETQVLVGFASGNVNIFVPNTCRKLQVSQVDFVIPYMTTHGMGTYRSFKFTLAPSGEPQGEFRKGAGDAEAKIVPFSELLASYLQSLEQ